MLVETLACHSREGGNPLGFSRLHLDACLRRHDNYYFRSLSSTLFGEEPIFFLIPQFSLDVAPFYTLPEFTYGTPI